MKATSLEENVLSGVERQLPAVIARAQERLVDSDPQHITTFIRVLIQDMLPRTPEKFQNTTNANVQWIRENLEAILFGWSVKDVKGYMHQVITTGTNNGSESKEDVDEDDLYATPGWVDPLPPTFSADDWEKIYAHFAHENRHEWIPHVREVLTFHLDPVPSESELGIFVSGLMQQVAHELVYEGITAMSEEDACDLFRSKMCDSIYGNDWDLATQYARFLEPWTPPEEAN